MVLYWSGLFFKDVSFAHYFRSSCSVQPGQGQHVDFVRTPFPWTLCGPRKHCFEWFWAIIECGTQHEIHKCCWVTVRCLSMTEQKRWTCESINWSTGVKQNCNSDEYFVVSYFSRFKLEICSKWKLGKYRKDLFQISFPSLSFCCSSYWSPQQTVCLHPTLWVHTGRVWRVQ